MRSTAGACALAILAMAGGAAHAEGVRSMFCVAVRTVPVLDQNNYVMGSTGPVYMTPNFTTDLSDVEVAQAWRAFVVQRHPVGYPDNPDDTCQLANSRRALIAAQRGDIKNVSVTWAPAKEASRSTGK